MDGIAVTATGTPNFYQYSVIVSSGLFVVFFAVHLVLFVARQLLQLKESRLMNKIKKLKLNKNIHTTVDDHHKRLLKKQDKALCHALDVSFMFESLMLMLSMFSLVTYLVAAVAFNFINWGYSFGFGMAIIFFTAIHTSRVRRIARSNSLKNYKDVTKRLNEEENENLLFVNVNDFKGNKRKTVVVDVAEVEMLSPDGKGNTLSDLAKAEAEANAITPNTPADAQSPASATTLLPNNAPTNNFQFKYEHSAYVSLLRCFEPFEVYFRSIQHGSLRGYRLPLFLTWFGLVMITTFVLTGVFYGTCICTEPYNFSTTFSRYTNGLACGEYEICSVIAMLPEDPSTQMIIKFYTSEVPDSSIIKYGYNTNITFKSQNCVVDDLNEQVVELENRYLHTCNLKGLTPSTTYNFTLIVGFLVYDNSLNITLNSTANQIDTETNYLFFTGVNGRTSKFRTFSGLPNDSVSFVTGGDQGAFDLSTTLVKLAASLNPKFIAIGGDLNYDNGLAACYRRVLSGINVFSQNAFDSSGNMIPLLTAIGNHEALFYQFGVTSRNSIINYLLFYSHQVNLGYNNRTTYHAHNLNGCSMVVLDSGVFTPHADQVDFIQSSWIGLDRTKMAMYHAPLYPSSRSVNDSTVVNGRKYWEPVFNDMGVTMAFENHDHTLKRTFPINNNKIVIDGSKAVVYVGDGNMGVKPRYPDNTRTYLAKATSDSHIWQVTCSLTGGVTATAISQGGVRLDSVTRPPQQNL